MADNNSWVFQGRQYHQWFGHGTAPSNGRERAAPPVGSLFDVLSVKQRIDYVAASLIGHADRKDRRRWESSLSQSGQDQLGTVVAAWYGARSLGRDAFREQLLDAYTSDETVNLLRSAVRSIVDARTHNELGTAGAELASAVKKVGVERWPRYLADAERRAMAAVSSGTVPGIIKASAAGTDTGQVVVLGGLALLLYALISRNSTPSRPAATPSRPTTVQQSAPEKGKGDKADAPPAELAKPGDATLADDRRKHILDGDGNGRGGHGPGRGTPGKSEFPSEWSDEKTAEAIKDVANDPTSTRRLKESGRTLVNGTRDGVDIEVIIGRDGKAIVIAYPTNITPKGR